MMGALETRTPRDWEWVLGVNLWGVIHGVLAFVPRMLAQPGEKHIVNTGSTAGLLAAPGVGIYGTAKFGVVGLSEHLRHDLARHGIGVSVLCPGGVKTNILHSERNRPAGLGKSKISREDIELVLGGSVVHPDEMQPPEAIAAAVLEGVRANDAFIVTHAHYRGAVRGAPRGADASLRQGRRAEGGRLPSRAPRAGGAILARASEPAARRRPPRCARPAAQLFASRAHRDLRVVARDQRAPAVRRDRRAGPRASGRRRRRARV